MNNEYLNSRLFDLVTDNSDYSIPEEGACSAEFPGGCIICDEN